MKLIKASHKAFLFLQFYPEVSGKRQERKFPLEHLMDASAALKKLKSVATPTEGGGFRWDDSDLEFSENEADVFAKLIGSIKEAVPSELEIISELKELLK